MNGSDQSATTVVVRTASAILKGTLHTPSRIRLSGYMNGPSPTADITEATMKTGPRTKERPVGAISIPKAAVIYVFLGGDADSEECTTYEREAMEGRLSEEPYFLLLGPGIETTARIFGGAHAVMRPRSTFTSVDETVLHDKMLGPKARKPQTMIVNVKQVECCYPVAWSE